MYYFKLHFTSQICNERCPGPTPSSPIINMKLLQFFLTTSIGFGEFSFKDLYTGLDCLLHSSLPRIAHSRLMMSETLPWAPGYPPCQLPTSLLLFSSFQTFLNGHFPYTRILVATPVLYRRRHISSWYLFFLNYLFLWRALICSFIVKGKKSNVEQRKDYSENLRLSPTTD